VHGDAHATRMATCLGTFQSSVALQGHQDREKSRGGLLKSLSKAKRGIASVQRIADAMSSVQGRPAESGAVSGGAGLNADRSDNVECQGDHANDARDNGGGRGSTSTVDMEVAVFKDLVSATYQASGYLSV
jgi:hypothetical protein